MRIREIMSSPVVAVPPDMRLKDVADLLVTNEISAVPVVEDGELVGIVSEADLVPLELAPDPRAHLAPSPSPVSDSPRVAEEAMTRAVVALPEDADVAEAGRLMLERRIRSIPIVRGRRVVGIVARRDLLGILAHSDEAIAKDLEALLAGELGTPCPYQVRVRDGIVELTGPLTRPAAGWPSCLLEAFPESSRWGSTRNKHDRFFVGHQEDRRGVWARADGAGDEFRRPGRGKRSMRQVSVGAAAGLAAVGGYAALDRLGQTWGATGQEQRQALPGDELLPDATALTTHAITIEAPAHQVWPWLMQMGWGQAGWYTYRWVDRLLFPANAPSANQILPEHQQLRVGDHVRDGPPEVDCWFTVERLEPDRLLALRSTRHLPASWRQRGLAMEWIWSWQLGEPTPGRTRLIQRNRIRLDPPWFERAFLATIIPADFVMARSHLRGLQRRAEAPTAQPIAV